MSDIQELSYFINVDMIKFLLAENLALKSILLEKGILTVEEFKTHKEVAERLLMDKVNAHLQR